MTLAQIVLLVYALVMALGGWMGHKMAKSKASLIAGVVSGALLLVALGMSFGNLAAGRWAGVAISGVLTVMFFIRVKKTKKIMPSGMRAKPRMNSPLLTPSCRPISRNCPVAVSKRHRPSRPKIHTRRRCMHCRSILKHL